MPKPKYELLKQLTEAVGVSGDEKEVRLLIHGLIVDHVDEWRVDTMGNLIATKKGTGASTMRVLVDAHMDEVGMLITGIDSDGTLKFTTIGGIRDLTLLGKTVQVGRKKLLGVIGSQPIHLIKPAQLNSVVKAESMRIDIGAKSKQDAGKRVKIGDVATFVTEYEELGEMALGKAFDDRAGCAALIELLQGEPFPFDLVAAFTVQEEIGLRGAGVASYSVNPDVALVLESTPAYDQPNERDTSSNVSLGKGPSIYVMDRMALHDRRLVDHITRVAAEEEIPYQIRQPGGGGTNTGAIQRAGKPVPTAAIATPGRYAHGPVAMISLEDYAHVVELADLSLRSLTPETISLDG